VRVLIDDKSTFGSFDDSAKYTPLISHDVLYAPHSAKAI
jgi:hypothetical protein